MATELEMAFKALTAKQDPFKRYFDYYDGNQPLVYSTERLREVFGDKLKAHFSQNWCAVVIDSVLERLNLAQFSIPKDENAQATLNAVWTKTEMRLDSDDAHLAALVTGEAYVIVWKDEGGEVQAYYNDPRLCHLFYDQENPRRKRYAAKWWVGEDGLRHLTLYYPDKLAYYVSSKVASEVAAPPTSAPMTPPRRPTPTASCPSSTCCGSGGC